MSPYTIDCPYCDTMFLGKFEAAAHVQECAANPLVQKCHEWEAKVAQLQAIVDKLPKDAEGVTKLPGDIVWRVSEEGMEKRLVQWASEWSPWPGYRASYGIEGPPVPVEECHSTREAAEAARKDG